MIGILTVITALMLFITKDNLTNLQLSSVTLMVNVIYRKRILQPIPMSQAQSTTPVMRVNLDIQKEIGILY